MSKTLEKYNCKWCHVQGEQHFTKHTFRECRSCRTERNKDVYWRQLSDVLATQRLEKKYWKAQ